MEITWFGYSCFRLKGRNTSVITDPFPPGLGYTLEKQSARIVTISHNHPDHSFSEAVAGEPKVVYRPGEYEIGGVLIIGIPTFHDAENGAVLGKNNVYAIEVDDVNICHLGDLGHPLSAKQIEELGNVDVLLVPVGGGSTISASQAAALVRSLEPKIVIPMHYKTLTLTKQLDGVDKFLKEMGLTEVASQPKLTVTKASLPLATQVTVLSA
ncbi:MAG TPA: MBL fold metallo-hydrolase [Dehalococcoidales bacterium]|jgi:L-ascorbate metabolism protein UlaG (beta-lactamase superfamily)